MQTAKLAKIFLVCACAILISGCAELDDLKIKNDIQLKQIDELQSELQTAKLKLEQAKRELETVDSRTDVKAEALKQKIAALEEDLQRKKDLISQMQQQLLGGVSLPAELSTMLEDFAKDREMVTYDASRGIVKFKSDLLFERGSVKVAASAEDAVKSLCGIMNSEQGKGFDIIIAGHTDDLPISRPATRQQHPTNWHLSAHRAISVLNVMTKNNITAQRLSVRGFGEFRPATANRPDQKGNPQNRRVEIYIVAPGT